MEVHLKIRKRHNNPINMCALVLVPDVVVNSLTLPCPSTFRKYLVWTVIMVTRWEWYSLLGYWPYLIPRKRWVCPFPSMQRNLKNTVEMYLSWMKWHVVISAIFTPCSTDALQRNQEMEFQRNKERFQFLKWGAKAFRNMLIVPPGSGIVHQVNSISLLLN